MTVQLILAIVFITLALVFYTIGVWWERRNGSLRIVHFVFFCMGLACDITGTTIMSIMAKTGNINADGGMVSIHGITGAIAIVLMLLHALWALIVLVRNRDSEKHNFHRFSMFVWVIWLVPYLIGMIMGMKG